jgi:hypothetical protein
VLVIARAFPTADLFLVAGERPQPRASCRQSTLNLNRVARLRGQTDRQTIPKPDPYCAVARSSPWAKLLQPASPLEDRQTDSPGRGSCSRRRCPWRTDRQFLAEAPASDWLPSGGQRRITTALAEVAVCGGEVARRIGYNWSYLACIIGHVVPI